MSMNSNQFKRWLAKRGCTFEPGKGGHLTVRRSEKVATLPQHGGAKQLKTGLMRGIVKQLGIEE
jgi:mRNA interferase HicA